MKELRRFRDQGTTLSDQLADMIFSAGLTGSEVAAQTGKSEASIFCILSPAHDAQFTVKDLPMLLEILDGKEILKTICGWMKMVPAEIPDGKPSHNQVMGTAGQLLSVVSKAVEDGELTFKEILQIRSKLANLIGAIDTMTGNVLGGMKCPTS